MWGGYLEGVRRLSGGCGKDDWWVWGGCLELGEAVGRGWGGYWVGVGRLNGGCGESVWRVW